LGARTHARLDRAELMLDCLAPYTHLLRMLVEPALNSLEYMLVLPSRDTRCYFWIDPREEIVGVYMAAAPSPMRVYYRRMVRGWCTRPWSIDGTVSLAEERRPPTPAVHCRTTMRQDDRQHGRIKGRPDTG
jgi:hypothetical protein